MLLKGTYKLIPNEFLKSCLIKVDVLNRLQKKTFLTFSNSKMATREFGSKTKEVDVSSGALGISVRISNSSSRQKKRWERLGWLVET